MSVFQTIGVAFRSSISETDRAGRKRGVRQIEAILRAYVVLGITTFLIAISFFGLTFIDITLTVAQQVALMISALGLMLSIMSFALLLIRRQQREGALLAQRLVEQVTNATPGEANAPSGAAYEVVRQWARFEDLSRSFFSLKGDKYNYRSPRQIFDKLASEALISSADARELHMALDVRNRLVHSTDEMDPTLVSAALNILLRLNDMLEHLDVLPDA